jgi:hypothetical protein
MRRWKLCLLVIATSIPQSLLAVVTGVPHLTWWQWSALNAPLIALVFVVAALTEK